MPKFKVKPCDNPALHRGVAIFHHAEDGSPFGLNPVNISRIDISSSEPHDTMVYWGRDYAYVTEKLEDALVIMANALNGVTAWEAL